MNKQTCLYFTDNYNYKNLTDRVLGDIKSLKKININKVLNIINFDQTSHSTIHKLILDTLETKLNNNFNTVRLVICFTKTKSYKNLNFSNIVTHLNIECMKKPIILLFQFEIDKLGGRSFLNLLKMHKKIIENNYLYTNPFNIQINEIVDLLKKEENMIKKLTKKELEILTHIVNGLTAASISEVCCISKRTVETHKLNIMKKLNVNKSVDLVKFAVKNGVV